MDPDRPLARKVARAIRLAMGNFLELLGDRVSSAAGRAKKAADDDLGLDEVLDSVSYDALHDDLLREIMRLVQDSASTSLGLVLPSDAGSLDRMLSQANERAVAWAEERVGELITAIDETTRQGVRDIVSIGLDEGWTNTEIAEELDGSELFGDSRADMIARTETAFADVRGSLIGWQESGVVSSKRWLVSEAEVCDRCMALHGVAVALDGEFPDDGGEGPPLHPNCRCDVVPVLLPEDT